MYVSLTEYQILLFLYAKGCTDFKLIILTLLNALAISSLYSESYHLGHSLIPNHSTHFTYVQCM